MSKTQLWSTDGTAAGTVKVTTINAAGSAGLSPSNFTLFNSRLYFMGIETGGFYQLWSTDGTTAGTVMVKGDRTFQNGTSGFNPSSMAVHKTLLYTAGYDSLSASVQLFSTDGTAAGTKKITTYKGGLYPTRLFSFQNRLIMTGSDTLSKQEQLFASDGTAAGTVCPTPPDTWGQYPFYPWEAWVPFNNALYYRGAYSYFADYQLCRYTETAPTGVASTKDIPETFALMQNYPNPFNPSTSISFSLPARSFVSLTVFDVMGREVATLASEDLTAGSHMRQWNAEGMPSGVYFYRLQAGSLTETKRLVLVR